MPIGSIIGGLIGSGGASSAGGAYGAAGNQAYQNAQADAALARSAVSNWTESGKSAQNEIDQLLGLGHIVGSGDGRGGQMVDQSTRTQDQQNALARFQTDPGYTFRLQQGVNALDRSAASRGSLFSGAQTKALNDYGQGMGSAEYGNYYNRLAGVSGQGLTGANAANGVSGVIENTGNQLAYQGAAGRASSYANSANALASGISSGINNLFSLGAYTGIL